MESGNQEQIIQHFPLTIDQLQKIYEIRERMIHSKFTQNIESEKAFINCIDNVLSKPSNFNVAESSSSSFCERTFDGWTCFNDTPAGEVSYFPCPDFVYGFNPQSLFFFFVLITKIINNTVIDSYKKNSFFSFCTTKTTKTDQAHKTCTKEGKWRVHHETHVPWTNYTSCVDIPDLNVSLLLLLKLIFFPLNYLFT
ncbi:hypothetical protein BLA29_009092 [Euroglyphus maynei]|uniref:G-protein coupled receptors family 2 profile 1 domain-containing protein n=1 Tax=Euroglyphus maynei TaxID=6958 RepID=A0A1Y3BCF8_EURMA|nr:hypothetical protein BLA29_009092 [Euroglyphus maynei]